MRARMRRALLSLFKCKQPFWIDCVIHLMAICIEQLFSCQESSNSPSLPYFVDRIDGWDWPECTTTRTANLLKCSLEHSLWLAGLCWTGFIEKFIHSFTEKSTQRWNIKMGYDMKALYHIRLNLLVESLILRIMFHSILVNHRKHWKFELIHKPRFQFTNRLLIDVNIL